MPPMTQGPLTRLQLQKVLSPPNSVTLGTNLLTHGPLGDTHPNPSIHQR
jgi:hypothetical protein